MKKSSWTIEKVVQALYDEKTIENVTKRNVKLLKSYTEMAAKSGAEKKRPSRPTSSRGTPGSGGNFRSPLGKTPGEFGSPTPGHGEVDCSKVNFILTPNGKNL